MPELTVVVGKGSRLHHQADGKLLVGRPGQNFNCIERSRAALAVKAQAQKSIAGGANVAENAFIGDICA